MEKFAHQSRLDRIKQINYYSFENCSIAPSSSISVSFTNDTYFPKFQRNEKDGTADLAYCKMSVWDACPINPLQGTTETQVFQSESSGSNEGDCCSKLFFAKYPGLRSKVVVVHLVRPWVCRVSFGAAPREHIHCLENLRAIPIELFDSPRVQEFLRERAIFSFGHDARQMSVYWNENTLLSAKYAGIFTDR
jgi:hypothetical protein